MEKDVEGDKVDRTPRARCARCNCPYGSHGFHDLIVPDDVWAQISPTGDEGGLLCPTCIIAALDELGLKDVPVYFASGPARVVDRGEDVPGDWMEDLHHKILDALRFAVQEKEDHPEWDNELRTVAVELNEAAFMMEAIRARAGNSS